MFAYSQKFRNIPSIKFGIQEINFLQVSIGIFWVKRDEVKAVHWRKGGWLRNRNRRIIRSIISIII